MAYHARGFAGFGQTARKPDMKNNILGGYSGLVRMSFQATEAQKRSESEFAGARVQVITSIKDASYQYMVEPD